MTDNHQGPGSDAPDGENTDAVRTSFPLSGPINLHARVAHGSLTVHAEESITAAEVVVAPRAKGSDIVARCVVEMRGPTLTVLTPRRGGIFELGAFGGPVNSRDEVDITVTVPAGAALKLGSYTAPIVVTGRGGSADVSAGAADITVAHIDGDLRLRFGSGRARTERVTGAVQVRSGSGDASFGEVVGSLACGCGSGNLDVTAARGTVRSRTGSGSARLAAVYADVDLASGSGGVEIGLPAGHAAQLNVVTGSGRVRSDLPVDDQPRPGSPRIAIRARTGSGDVRLFRAPATGESAPTDAA